VLHRELIFSRSNGFYSSCTTFVSGSGHQAILTYCLLVECPLVQQASKTVTSYSNPNFFARSKIILTDDGSHLLRPLGVRSRMGLQPGAEGLQRHFGIGAFDACDDGGQAVIFVGCGGA